MTRFLSIFTTFLLLCISSAFAQIEILEIDNDNSFEKLKPYWSPNLGLMNKQPGAEISLDSNGRTGKCLKITNNAEGLAALYSDSLVAVDSEYDIFNFSIYVKGKGQFYIGFYQYSAEKKYLGNYYAKVASVDTNDWQKLDYKFEAAKFKKGCAGMRIVIEVRPGEAELYFDDFSGHRESDLQKRGILP